METLNTLTLPLNCSSLIEASAGTGKTHTIKNLYLRLLLGISHNDEPLQPLTVEQILVVTFTKAATEELKDRIRENIQQCYAFFSAQLNGQAVENNDFFADLYEQVEKKEEALLRLRIAEREIDLASVFTIHSFCQKMLYQFAFDSGISFEFELQQNEQHLLERLAQEVWREQFYPMSLDETAVVAEELKTPQNTLEAVRAYLTEALPDLSAEQQSINEQFTSHLQGYQQLLVEVRQYWQTHRAEIVEPIIFELNKKYKTGEKKALNRRSYQMRYVENWLKSLDAWAESNAIYFPTDHFSRFCQDFLVEKAEEGAEPLSSAHFAKNQAFLTAYQTQYENKQKSLLLYQFLMRLREKLADYKASHTEKSFDDLLIMLNQALKGSRGKQLASQIRQQFPFAMIDEFQDTDQTQYDIFRQIYMADEGQNQGFIMIGDPKQSIYKFRGADIFTYLEAASHADEQRTLDKNWRSLPKVVDAVNQLFAFPADCEHPPFLYNGIAFQPVQAKTATDNLIGSENVVCYLQPEFDESEAAEHCADQIQQQLQAMQVGEIYLQNVKDQSSTLFEAKDIAVLVRSVNQAKLIKKALAKRGLKSVFLSERSRVYESEIAPELAWLLKACLNPYHQNTLLCTLGSSLWGLTAAQIYQLKNDEREWESYVDKFVHYQEVWQKQGVLPMLHQLFLQEGIIERLKARPNADRLLTDLFHLAEILQSAMQEVENESSLVRWYEQTLNDAENGDDTHTLRLESEEALIKIVTIHGSKGLQYPIVWLPFIGKNSASVKASALSLYHDENAQKHWDFGGNNEEIKTLKNKAEFAEDLRLLYVALTRAESQLNLILPARFQKGWNSVHYLLSNGEIALNEKAETTQETTAYLAEKGLDCEVKVLEETAQERYWSPEQESPISLQVREFNYTIATTQGQITSFSALSNYNDWALDTHGKGQAQEDYLAQIGDFTQDYDNQTASEEAIFEQLEQAGEIEPENANSLNAYQFPHSTKVGNILHRFWEHFDFEQAVTTEDVAPICEQLNLDEKWLEPLQEWLEQVRSTPFSPDEFALSEISSATRLNEWQFFLRLQNEEGLRKLNQLLQQHSELAKALPPLQLPQLSGYVRGFIDCIAKVKGKFYVIDYKSNFLGYLPQDYRPSRLLKTIGQYRYDLQYLLYALAVHRYLRSRLGESYDYEQHFGGVAYLFLRGMNGEPHSGVYFDKPNKELIDELDLLFG
nr:exodeoxyribonuclease V subunit beta [uncultured Haemophilus sp.]